MFANNGNNIIQFINILKYINTLHVLQLYTQNDMTADDAEQNPRSML